MISLTLENPLYRFGDDSTLCCDIPNLSERQEAASYLASNLDKTTSLSNTWNMSVNSEKSHTLTPSFSLQRTIWHPLYHNSTLPPISFLNNPLEEVHLLKPLSLTISHNLSWTNHISKLASKASHRLGDLFLESPLMKLS